MVSKSTVLFFFSAWVGAVNASQSPQFSPSPLSFRLRPRPLHPSLSKNRGQRRNQARDERRAAPASTRTRLRPPSLESLVGGTGFYYGIGGDLLRDDAHFRKKPPRSPRRPSDEEESSSPLRQRRQPDGESGDEDCRPGVDEPQRFGSTDGPNTDASGQGGEATASSQIGPGRGLADESFPQHDVGSGARGEIVEDEDNNMAVFRNVMCETLNEFRRTADDLKENLVLLRQEMANFNRMQQHAMRERRREFSDERDDDDDDDDDDRIEYGDEDPTSPYELMAWRRRRRKKFDKLAQTVEQWGRTLLFEEGGEEDGWREVNCMKLLRKKLNPKGTTRCFVKWLPDSRGDEYKKDGDEGSLFPCIKCYGIIDAPFEQVCAYLADETTVADYNDLVESFRDLEEVSPHSKICWGQCPQVLFIKPRDFVTFCSHRWKKDGTQVVVNQAVDHDDAPGVEEEGKSRFCRARALRGANFITRDPDDPSKTHFSLLAHGDPGGLPSWACKKAVGAVAPIEPYKLFHKMEKAIKETPLQPKSELVSAQPGRSTKPGGLSQLGYACFWPNGGGLLEGHDGRHHYSDGLEDEQSPNVQKDLAKRSMNAPDAQEGFQGESSVKSATESIPPLLFVP